MKQPRKFKCEFTYKQLIIINDLINDYIIRKDEEGIDVFSDEKCKMLRDVHTEIISSYTGMNQ